LVLLKKESIGMNRKAFWGRLKALWFILRHKNFILIYGIEEKPVSGQPGRRCAYLRRTDYNTESDFYTMKMSMCTQFGWQIMDSNKKIGDYVPKK